MRYYRLAFGIHDDKISWAKSYFDEEDSDYFYITGNEEEMREYLQIFKREVSVETGVNKLKIYRKIWAIKEALGEEDEI